MNALVLMKETAALGGYGITGTDAQSVANKARALRRVNLVRSTMASRFSGRWASMYREGWLPLVSVYSAGTVQVTLDSRTVTGESTAWTSAMVGRKFLGPDNAYYKIAAVASTTSLTLTQPYQSATVATGGAYQIWKDEYVLYPDVYSIVDFINYASPIQMTEDTTRHGRSINPRATANETPSIFSVLGRKRISGAYSTGTLLATANSRTITGASTSWLSNIEPGYEITIGSYTYHVDTVDSDTQITLIENAVETAVAGTSYTAVGRNALIIRFTKPASQQIVSYGYYCKSYPLVNDSDEDWMTELYSHVISAGVAKYDYMDKNDPVRASQASQIFENEISNAHVADASQYGGTYVVGLDIPDSARQ